MQPGQREAVRLSVGLASSENQPSESESEVAINANTLERVDSAIEKRHLLKHPFYEQWREGTLRREQLQLYAAQYYWHVEAFPAHLKTLAARARGELHRLILENLAEEEDPRAPHTKLWRDFATAVGVKEDILWTTSALPGVQTLLDAYRKISSEGTLEEAVAALYAYEAQVPEIARTKMEGLRTRYGVTTRGGLAYFEVHEEADVRHRAAWRNWLEQTDRSSKGSAAEAIVESTESALSALWGALNSVQAATF